LKIVLFFPILLKLARRNAETTLDLPDADHQEAIRVCIDQSHASIISIHNFFAKEPSNPLRDWYAQYCLIQGALVSILALQINLDFLKDYRATLLSDIEMIKTLLEGLTNQHPRARTMLDIINQVSTSHSSNNQGESATTFDSDVFRQAWSGPLENQIDPWLQDFWPETSWDQVS